MNKPSIIVLIAAVLYGISIPLSKIFLSDNIQPIMLASFTYLGAGIGMLFCNFSTLIKQKHFKNHLTKNDVPYTLAMVLLDISAIVFLMYGLTKTYSANASLISNVEIASTTIVAFLFFKEKITKKLTTGIVLIIIAALLITFEGNHSFDFTLGSIFVAFAYIFWGFENNCTKMISSKNTQEITVIKGICSGVGSLILAFIAGETLPAIKGVFTIMFIGFFSYGLSVAMYIYSQKFLGAAKTAAYFSTAPFFGVLFSFVFLREHPQIQFYIALLIMVVAIYVINKDLSK